MPQPFEIRREIALRATPAQVWAAVATGDGQAAWFMAMPDPEPASELVTGWEPEHRMAMQMPAGEDGSFHAFEYLIDAGEGGTTVLRFVHSGMTGDDWDDEFETMTGYGWDMYLATLAAYLEHFAGRPATYVEAEAPATTADEAGWRAVLEALGVDDPADPAVLGRRITVALDAGLDTALDTKLDGEVDYHGDRFLGLRTDDALIRFHGRWSLGMPVAISHHAYARADDAPVDADALTHAWTAWLAAAGS